ncbi:MAG: sigma-54-dependent Fis family transcriptional regulator [Flavobacteriales bacterium]|nr:sigma-54-dependent Fis family transcriptional regulator [Bacteroidota bacterium]MCB9239759.1 sigma-54-dependent Fis family transcriptional regulator [Flavobacteriales bacterium]
MPKIYVVDDNPMYAATVAHAFKQDLFQVSEFHSGTEYLNQLDSSVDIAILDHHLPDITGLDLLIKSKEINPELSVIILSGQEDISMVSQFYKHGAYCYIVKDDNALPELAHKVRNLLNTVNLKKEVKLLEEELEDRSKYNRIIGNSPATLRMLKMIQRVEKTDATVMITGESGTGKELVAEAVHYNSNRRRKPFVAVNIAAIPDNLIEDELFGHEKGAFTGAIGRRKGKFEEAQGGTIFLDEIGEMEIGLQAKLLRVLQERKMTRLGSNKEMKLDIRIIAATHRDLAHQVREGKFREDLYYRIQGFPIQVPKLRDRGRDVILLCEHFLKISAEKNRMPARTFSEAAQKELMKHKWPGNVRELIAAMERTALVCDKEIVSVESLILNENSTEITKPVSLSEAAKANGGLDGDVLDLAKKLAELRQLEPLLRALDSQKNPA